MARPRAAPAAAGEPSCPSWSSRRSTASPSCCTTRTGRSRSATTRGDNEVGGTSRRTCARCRPFPLAIPVDGGRTKAPSRLVVRGEIYMERAAFARFNEQAARGEGHANPRNFAASSLRQLDPSVTATRPLRLWAYQVVVVDGAVSTRNGRRSIGCAGSAFPVAGGARGSRPSTRWPAFCAAWPERRETLPYETDGLVVKVDKRASSGAARCGRQRAALAVAYKFPSTEVGHEAERDRRQRRTHWRADAVRGARAGIGSVTVPATRRCNNADYIQKRDIRIGDHVVVKRARRGHSAGAAPGAELRTGDERRYSSCRSIVPRAARRPSKLEDEVATYCVNSACRRSSCARSSTSCRAVPWTSTASASGRRAVRRGRRSSRTSPTSSRSPPTTSTACPASSRSASTSWSQRSRTRRIARWRVLTALGIRGVGEIVAQNLIEHFGSLDALEKATAEDPAGDHRHRPDPRRERDRVVLAPAQPAHRREAAAAGVRTVVEERAPDGEGGPKPTACVRHHRNAADLRPRAGVGDDPRGGRQGHGIGQREDQLPGRGRGRRQQARQGAQAERAGDRGPALLELIEKGPPPGE